MNPLLRCAASRRGRIAHTGARCLFAAWAAIALGPALAEQPVAEPCGALTNGYGPFDYRTQRSMLAIVDQFHFTSQVENLIKPLGQHFGGDFDYTLRASPNHHRALITMARFSRQTRDPQPPAMRYSVDCFFDRAMRFAPDDHVVRMIYADHLIKLGRTDAAVKHLDFAATFAADNPVTHFNLGLLYVDAKSFDKALAHAHQAQQLGLSRPELKKKLVAEGKWVDAPPAAAPAAPAASVPGTN